jgi:hypothetical protein
MFAVILFICIVGVLPLLTAGACALFIALGGAEPNTTTQRFVPSSYQPMVILTHSAHVA